MTFQDPASSSMEGIIDVHHDLMFYIFIIISFVFSMLVRAVFLFTGSLPYSTEGLPYSTITHQVGLEWAWTLIPAFFLLAMSGPSFALLYSLESLAEPEMTLKVEGHQ
jgi:cytochrome c oxidase subunit 2